MKRCSTLLDKVKQKVGAMLIAFFAILAIGANAQTPTINVGDYISTPEGVVGVVFYTNTTHTEGSIVAMHDLPSLYTWMDGTTTVGSQTYTSNTSALSDSNGFENSAYIRAAISEGATSSIWGAVSTSDLDNGWYLPSAGQAKIISDNRVIINTAITSNSGDEIGTDSYWTSSIVQSNGRAWRIAMYNGALSSVNRSTTCRVRGIYDIRYDGAEWHTIHRNCSYPIPDEDDVQFACDSLTWIDGTTYIYPDHFTSADRIGWVVVSNVTHCMVNKLLVLTTGHTTRSHNTVQACETYSWTSINPYPINPLTVDGTYCMEATNSEGCRQYDTITLTINHNTTSDTTATACDSYTWTTWAADAATPHMETYPTPLTVSNTNPSLSWEMPNHCTHTRTLHLTIENSEHPDTTVTDACNSFYWDRKDTTYTDDGSYYFPYTASNGCESQATLHLTLKHSTDTVTRDTLCEGASKVWHATTYTHTSPAGGNTFSYTNTEGCPSTDTLYLVVWEKKDTNITLNACQQYVWKAQDGITDTTIMQSGTYENTFMTIHGCDSTVTLHIIIRQPDVARVDTIDTCDYFRWVDNKTYTTTGTYLYSHTSQDVCETVDTLRLKIRKGSYHAEVRSECQGYIWVKDSSQTYSTSGTYIHTDTLANRCLSVDTLHLTLRNLGHGTFDTTVCGSYTWALHDNITFTGDTVLTDTLERNFVNGCDSLITLRLHVKSNTASTLTTQSCDNYTWYVFDADGTRHYAGTFVETPATAPVYRAKNAIGCDSIVTLNLTISKSRYSTITRVACDHFTLSTNNYAQNNPITRDYNRTCVDTIFFRNGASNHCDSSIVLNLTIHNKSFGTFTDSACYNYTWKVSDFNRTYYRSIKTYQESNYTDTAHVKNSYECDSIITLNLTIYHHQDGNFYDTSCGTYNWTVYDYDGTPHNVTTFNTLGNQNLALPDTINLKDSHGCDSTVTLHLTILPSRVDTDDNQMTCWNTPFRWYVDGNFAGQYDAPNNTATYALHTIHGCDSIIHLNLTARQPNLDTLNIDTCQSFTWYAANWDGSNYHQVEPALTANTYGHYHTKVVDQYGCDSVITLNLTIHHPTNVDADLSTCSSPYTWKVRDTRTNSDRTIGTYSVAPGLNAGIANSTIIDKYGCDSIITLNLTLHTPQVVYLDTMVCDSVFNWVIKDFGATTPKAIIPFTASINNNSPIHVIDHNGCDSTVYLNLTINRPTITNDTQYFCHNFSWNVIGAAGDTAMAFTSVLGDTIAYRNDVFTSSRNDLYAKVSGSNGCDSTIHLVLVKKYPTYETIQVDTCENFVWKATAADGTVFTHPGIYTASAMGEQLILTRGNTWGCDSTITMDLTIHTPQPTEHIYDTACYTYSWDVTNYDGSDPTHVGDYSANTVKTAINLTDRFGCDSTVTLHLTIIDTLRNTLNIASCYEYTWCVADFDGSNPQTIGYYTTSNATAGRAVVKSLMGCDSIITLNLTINDSTRGTALVDACDNYVWYVSNADGTNNHRAPIPGSALYSSSHNVFSTHVVDHNGCDSTVFLNLTIHTQRQMTVPFAACDSYLWNASNHDGTVVATHGPYFTNTITPEVRLKDQWGCDSIIRLDLTINSSNTGIAKIDTCNNAAFDWWVYDFGSTLGKFVGSFSSNNNTAYEHVVNSKGCDSTIYLNLTFHGPDTGDYYTSACHEYDWTVSNYDGSNSRTVGHFTSSTDLASANGLVSRYGCDSTVFLHLTILDTAHYTKNVYACGRLNSYTVNDFDGSNPQTFVGPFTNDTAFNATVMRMGGCDSIITINISIGSNVTSDIYAEACDVYNWDGRTYEIGGNYNRLYPQGSIHGCDSLANLHLSLKKTSRVTDDQVQCGSFTWMDGNIYIADNHTATHTVHHTFAEGCDTIYSLNLTIKDHQNVAATQSTCDSLVWEGQTLYTDGTYTTSRMTVDGVCDSTITMALTVKHSTTGSMSASSCDTYTWNVQGHNEVSPHVAGTYTASSTTITTTVENAVGCDSVITLNLTIKNSSRIIDSIESCTPIVWVDGITYSSNTTTPYVTGTNAVGCDSTTSLWLNIKSSSASVVPFVACDSAIFIAHNADGTVAGTYGPFFTNTTETIHVTNAEGCDSTITLNVTVNHSDLYLTTQASCINYFWRGSYRDATGIYADTLTNSYGCDSIIALDLTINTNTTGTKDTIVCSNFTYSYMGNTFVFYSDTVAIDHTTNVAGCDSTILLNITVKTPQRVFDTVYACDTYTWAASKHTFSNAGTHTDVAFITDSYGCNNTHVLLVNIKKNKNTIQDVTACGSYYWPLSQEGYIASTDSATFTYHRTYEQGCDSTITLNLTITPLTDTTTFDTTVCDQIVWNGATYTTDGRYENKLLTYAAGCDSVVYMNLNVKHSTSSTIDTTACDNFTWVVSKYGLLGRITVGTYTTSGMRDTVLPNAVGCDSIMRLNLTINNSNHIYDTNSACDAYTWIDGNTYTATTTLPSVTYTNAVNCDSIISLVLTITNSSTPELFQPVGLCDTYTWSVANFDGSGIQTIGTYVYNGDAIFDTAHVLNAVGCDSTIILNLNLNHSTASSQTASSCYDYTWRGNTYYASGDYYDTIRNRVGCDSIINLSLTINDTVYGDTLVYACSSFRYNGTTYTNDVNLIEHRTSLKGCDSVLTLHVLVNLPNGNTTTAYVCDSLRWNDSTYTASTSDYRILKNRLGCDSTDRLVLTVKPSTNHTFTKHACGTYYWPATQEVYTTNNNTAQYTYPRDYAHGCDSIVTLNLFIYDMHYTTVADTAVCEHLVWNGNTYTTSGPYTQNLTTQAAHCDSVVTINVEILHNNTSTIADTACDSYTWTVNKLDGTRTTVGTWNQSGLQTATIKNVAGCDSTITMNLVVLHRDSSFANDTACGLYRWMGIDYTTSGTYTHTTTTVQGCDSVMVLNLALVSGDTIDHVHVACDNFTWQGITLTEDTTVSIHYRNRFGCDSTLTLHLTLNHQTGSLDNVIACESFTWMNDSTYTTSTNTEFIVLPGANQYGCDSTITLQLTVNYSTLGYDHQSVCDSMTWIDGRTYTESDTTNTFLLAGANQYGCDSTIRLMLDVRHSSYAIDEQIAYRSFTWVDGNTYTQSTNEPVNILSTPNAEGCDSIVNLHLIISTFPAPEINNIRDFMLVVNHHPGNCSEYINYIDYRWYCNDSLVASGSDTYTIDAPLHGVYYVEIPTDYSRAHWMRSNAVSINHNAIDDISLTTALTINAMPNPVAANATLHVATSLSEADCQGAMLYLYDMQGRVVKKMRPEAEVTDIPVNFGSGVYTLQLIAADGRRVASKVIVR